MAGIVTVAVLAAVTVGEIVRFPGTCDASAAVLLDDGRLLVGNDEDNVLRIYSLRGEPKGEARLPALGSEEADIEGAARVGGNSYWITSQARDKGGDVRPERRRLFAVKLPEHGDLEPGPVFNGLLAAMLADPMLGPLLREASLKAPEVSGGLNVEGLAAGGAGGLLIGFRNPLPTGRSLVVALLNPDEVLAGQTARFGEPTLLDLGGLGIRSLERVGSACLIVAGPFGDEGPFRLFRWNGTSVELVSSLSDLPTLADLRPEALVEIAPGRVMILSDDGTRLVEGKRYKDAPADRRSFRGVELALPLGLPETPARR